MMVPIRKWEGIARDNYLEYMHALDNYSCGCELFEYFRPDMAIKMKLAERLVRACKWAEARRAIS